MIKLNTIGHQEWIVTKDRLASNISSGTVDVFATPCMIALMELTCANSVKDQLEDNQSTVGTLVNVQHLSATPLGMKVWCDSRLIKIDNRKLTFEINAYDDEGIIGKGIHERFIIDVKKFLDRVDLKRLHIVVNNYNKTAPTIEETAARQGLKTDEDVAKMIMKIRRERRNK